MLKRTLDKNQQNDFNVVNPRRAQINTKLVFLTDQKSWKVISRFGRLFEQIFIFENVSTERWQSRNLPTTFKEPLSQCTRWAILTKFVMLTTLE